MTTALTEREPVIVAPVVTADQLDLIKRTIAPDATPDELKLYLYDCARQGVHPLDKLIHFTKRGNPKKYTPITSIDFMRIRAASTGEYAGSDDAVFIGEAVQYPASATVTVWRLVQGQRYPFTATARWSEYKPAEDFMWRKMPHTMLGKCAEALALRKGFPKQLAGLYSKEEMDQAEAPARESTNPHVGSSVRPSEPNGGDSAASDQNAYWPEGLNGADLSQGQVYIIKVGVGMGPAKFFVNHTGQALTDSGLAYYEKDLSFNIVKGWCESGTPVKVKEKESATGKRYVKEITPMPTSDTVL